MGAVATDMGTPGILGVSIAVDDKTPDNRLPFEQLVLAAQTLSRAISPQPVLVVSVFCWGGLCERFDAVVIRNGESLFERRLESWNHGMSSEYFDALTEAAAYLGLSLDGGYFPPFESDAFDKLGKPCD